MKNSDNINDQFKFFCETLEDGDYLVAPEQSGAYGMLQLMIFCQKKIFFAAAKIFINIQRLVNVSMLVGSIP